MDEFKQLRCYLACIHKILIREPKKKKMVYEVSLYGLDFACFEEHDIHANIRIKVFEVFSFLEKNEKYCLNEVEALTIVCNGFKSITT